MTSTEFRPEGVLETNRAGAVQWIVSHLGRYPLLPLVVVVCTVVNNWLYSVIQVSVGRGFDLFSGPAWTTAQALAVALTVGGAALGQGLTGLGRNVAVEFMAQLFERNSREELYASLLGKSQTFHGRRRVGDIMARATGDVRALNAMISPGVMLILDSALALVMPLVMIGLLDPRLLLVPGIFTVLLVVTVWDYNRRLQPVSIAQRDQYGVMSADLTETIAGIEVVKANVREHYEWKIAYPVDTG